MPTKEIGLVLSGGGVRGIAHIGVIKALEEVGIFTTHIAGASAGALIGAFYASGHSTEAMLRFFQDTRVFSIKNYATKKPGLFDTEKILAYVSEMIGDDSFSSLDKKLYISASDMNHGTPRIFEQGPLLKPLLASAAFPGVFTPVEIDSILYADGGILNNFPIEPLLGQCKQIIGVFCNPVPQIKSEQMSTSLQVLERAFHMGMAQTSLKKFELCDLVISPSKLSKFSTFGINHIQEVHDIGYEAAKENLKNSPFS